MGSIEESWTVENGIEEWKQDRPQYIHKTPQNLSTSLLRKKSDPVIVSCVRFRIVRRFFADLQQVILGTKLCVLIPAVPFAILAHCLHFSRPCVFAFSLLGLAPLAERVSFLTEYVDFAVNFSLL